MFYLKNIHQEIKLSGTIWKGSGKAINFTTINTEMSVKRGQHIYESEKLKCKAIHVNKNAAENEGTNSDSNIATHSKYPLNTGLKCCIQSLDQEFELLSVLASRVFIKSIAKSQETLVMQEEAS